jgi:hypothetical protein
LGVLPARDVPSAFLDATNEEFEIIIADFSASCVG